MELLFLCIAFKVILVSGSSLSDKVKQTPPEIFIKNGQPTRIDCSHSNQDYNVILWYKQLKDGQLQLLGYMNVNQGYPEPGADVNMEGGASKDQICSLTLNKTSESSRYYCAASSGTGINNAEAYFGGGTKLTVLEKDHIITEPKVKILKPSPNECRNKKDEAKKKTLVCLAYDFYPDHVTVSWQVNGDNITDGVATDSAPKKKDKVYSISSRLRVSADVWYDPSSEFKCTVTFLNDNISTNHDAKMKGVEAIKIKDMTREEYLKITQAAKLSYGVFIFKSIIYGLFVTFLVWKLQRSNGKHI